MKKSRSSRLMSLFLILVLISVSVLQMTPAAYAATPVNSGVGIPVNVTAATTNDTAVLNWSAPGSGPVPTGYLILRNDVKIADVTTGTGFTDSGLAAGTSYTYKIQAYNTGSASSSVVVPVSTGSTIGNQPPIITSIYPPNGDASYAAHSTIYFMTSTSDSDGTVSTVKYYVNGVLLGQSADGKGMKSWYNVAQGDYSIAAAAVDNSGNTYTKVINISVGAGGTALRQLYKDTYINTWCTGTTSYYNVNASSTEKVKEGAYSFKVKNLAGKSSVNYRIISTSFNPYVSANKSNVALQFWIYADTAADTFKQSFYVTILSQNGTDTTECRLPLSSYLAAGDYQQWKLVTIPLSDFYNNGIYYKGTNGTNSAVAADFNWSSFLGAGFICSTTGLPDTTYFFDDLKFCSIPVHTDATLSDLKIDGTTVAGFAAGTLNYNVKLPAGAATIPTVTATVYDTGNATSVITQASALPGTATVKVTAQDGTTTQTYTIYFFKEISTENLKTYDATVLPDNYQTVKGWGLFPASIGPAFADKYAAHQALFKDLGITQFRVELRGQAGDGDGDLVTGPLDDLASVIKAGVNNGITKYTACVWTPPAGMKDNNDISGWLVKNVQHASLLQSKEQTFCDWIVKSINYIVSKGLPAPTFFSLQNEPDVYMDYQSCGYELDQYERVAKLLRKTLNAAGYSNITLIGPEGGGYNIEKWLGTGFSALKNDQEYADALGGFVLHSYPSQSMSLAQRNTNFQTYVQDASQFPAKDRWQGEYCNTTWPEDAEIDRVIDSMRIFTSDVAWAGANYWQWWMGWDSRYPITDKAQETLVGGDGVTSVTKGRHFEVLSKIFNSAPPGSIVKRMSTNDPSVTNAEVYQSDMMALTNDKSTVAMLINTSNEDKIYNVHGLTGMSATVYSVAAAFDGIQTMASKNVQDGTVSGVVIPARSVNLVVTSMTDTVPPEIQLVKDKNLFFDGVKYVSWNNRMLLRGKVDEPAEIKINGKTAALNPDFSFSALVDLPNAMNTIEIDAKDNFNNYSQPLIFNVAYDPNYLALMVDKTPTQVTDPDFIIRGTVNTPSAIKVNSDTVTAKDDLTFEYRTTLAEGQNHFVLTAKGVNGNASAPVEVNVFCDSKGPEVTLFNTQTLTEDWEYVLSGKSDEAVKSLQINGKDILLSADLSFCEKLTLAQGENTFIIRAVDLYGNASIKEFKVTFNQTALTPHNTDGVSYSRRAAANVTVDGNIDEADWHMDNKASKSISGLVGDPNNIVNFGTLWDDNNLYVAAKVYDNKICFGAAQVYKNDGIELFFNPSNAKAGTYTGKDKQLFISMNQNGNGMYVNTGAAYQTGWKNIDGGYTVEMAIPWSSLGLTPAEGLQIGFDIQNDDSDISGNRQSTIVWNGTASDYNDTSHFGTLVLTSKEDVTYIDKAVVQSMDTTAPITTLSADKQENNGWYSSNVNIALSAADNMSGVAKTEYRIGDSGNWNVYTGPISLSQDGTYLIEYHSTDNIGIVEDIKQQTIQIDKTAPVTAIAVNGTTGNGWYVSDAAITLSASDNLSGVGKTEYRIGDSGGWSIYTKPIVLAQDGIYTIQYRSTDKAGNVEDVKQQTVQIDKIAPMTSAIPAGTLLSNGAYNSDILLTLTAVDAQTGSGVEKIEYSFDGTN